MQLILQAQLMAMRMSLRSSTVGSKQNGWTMQHAQIRSPGGGYVLPFHWTRLILMANFHTSTIPRTLFYG